MTGPEYRAARKAMGLTQAALAERLDIGLRTVERIEKEGCTVVMGLAMGQLAFQQRKQERSTDLDGVIARLKAEKRSAPFAPLLVEGEG